MPIHPLRLAPALLLLTACSADPAPQSAAARAPDRAAAAPQDLPSGHNGHAFKDMAQESPDPVPEPAPAQRPPAEPASAPALAQDPAQHLHAAYPWLASGARPAPAPVEPLSRRFAPPPGFERVDLPPDSFGAFLRDLPLAAPGLPVLSFRGATILPPDHPNLAAVAALDVGDADLQQCADSVIRLHAEWRFARGHRDHRYRGASGLDLPFARYLKGERLVFKDGDLSWQDKGRPRRPDHAALRDYLDGVFAWANTGSLAHQAAKVARPDLRPGDFFVLPGGPGHAVLVLDLARGPGGDLALLLGQGFMPAQHFHILRPAPGATWFVIKPSDDAVKTPFWAPFPWTSLRRLDP